MAKIIIICGDSGSGKSAFMRNVATQYKNLTIIKKYTTREARSDENDAIEIQGNYREEEIKKLEYNYQKNNNLYGFSKKEIDKSLRNNKHAIVIIRDLNILDKIYNDYPNIVFPFFIERPFIISERIKSLKEQGRGKEEINKILTNPLDDTKNIYYPRLNFFKDRIILNPYNKPIDNMNEQFIKLCKKYDIILNKILFQHDQ